jgi:hypothetical protein
VLTADVLEGRGRLLQQGRLIANVDYHLTIPHQTHFLLNPTGKFRFNDEDYRGGFILLTPGDAEQISFAEYTLELAGNSRKTIRVERRYKEIKHKGELQVSFWVKVTKANLPEF